MSTKIILVVGGAGYIGSHMVKQLYQAGYRTVTLDNLSTGHREAVRYGDFVRGDTGDPLLLRELLQQHAFDAVMHFASCIEVGESVRQPIKYYRNNVSNTLTLLDALIEHGVKRIIFSSTAAVYGSPVHIPIAETHPRQPTNPYGTTKLIVEHALADYDHAYGLRSIALRYFNAAGADPDGELGERHSPETHLIPLVLQAASGRHRAITVYGEDYDTPDGTCVRDYVHVMDLCQAHLQALERLLQGGESERFNLGNARGYSVREVIDCARAVTGLEIPVQIGPRRPGDPAQLIADSRKAKNTLGWSPRYSDLATMIEHAWRWELTWPVRQPSRSAKVNEPKINTVTSR